MWAKGGDFFFSPIKDNKVFNMIWELPWRHTCEVTSAGDGGSYSSGGIFKTDLLPSFNLSYLIKSLLTYLPLLSFFV